MPIIKSAKKRVKVARKATSRNKRTKRNLKSALKAFTAKSTDKSLRSAQSSIDKALKKRIIHKNKAARLKSQASKKAKLAGLKISKTSAAKKTVAKKTTSKAKK
jgi:small subunit ribosomal protein S20